VVTTSPESIGMSIMTSHCSASRVERQAALDARRRVLPTVVPSAFANTAAILFS
jgi:hypothetical protein